MDNSSMMKEEMEESISVQGQGRIFITIRGQAKSSAIWIRRPKTVLVY